MTNPQPAVRVDAREALRDLLVHVDRETCVHEETSRGGFIWTICDQCGRKWADDEGGFKPHEDAPAVARARLICEALTPAPTEAGGVREPTKAVIAALAAAISLLERTPRAKKAAPSDRMFDQMLTDYRKALEDGRAALSSTPAADAGKFKIGNPVRKTKGSRWQGRMINAYLHDSKAARLAPPQPAGDET